jgi:hypothetical protein
VIRPPRWHRKCVPETTPLLLIVIWEIVAVMGVLEYGSHDMQRVAKTLILYDTLP